MYRAPENRNLVKTIKSKFENVENENLKKVVHSTVSNGFSGDWVPQNLSKQISDPGRRNVRRSPAFRIDNSEKTVAFERKAVCNRSFYFERVQQYNSALKNHSDANKQNNVSKTENVQSNLDVIKANEWKDSCIKPPPLTKSKSSLDFTAIRNKFEGSLEEKKSDQIKTKLESKNLAIVNNSTPVCTKSEKPKQIADFNNESTEIVNDIYNIKYPSDKIPSDNTEKLKAALQRPLPNGPAPKKPPRTFEHTPVNPKLKNTSFLHHRCKKQDEKAINKNNRHDPRYMLNKLENALRNNKIKLKKPVRLETSTTSGEDSDDSVLYKSKSQSKLPPLPVTPHAQSFNFNCFNGLTTCTTYETIKGPNSSFFVSCQTEPVYAEPYHFSQDEEKNDGINDKTKNLYYMSTSLLCDEDDKYMLNMSENINQQVSPDNSSISPATSLSDIAEPKSSENNDIPDSPSKIKHLIDTFETKQASNVKNEDRSRTHNIEKPKSSLYRTKAKSFDSETKDSSDELYAKIRKPDMDLIIDKFQTYARTTPKYQTPKLNKDDCLFYCCLVVEWNSDKPKIKFRYPPDVRLPERIEDLCYPEATSGPLDISNNAQCYSLVITNDKGERTFGYCRRVIPEGSTKCIPLAYCLLSSHRAPRFYEKILTELESRHGIPNKLRDELISKFYHNKFPRPGESIKIDLTTLFNNFNNELHSRDDARRPDSLDEKSFIQVNINGEYEDIDENNKTLEITVMLHHDIRYEQTDLKPLHSLPSDVLLKIFASLLLERKVILVSCVISKLSSCVEALQNILYPFSWPHAFIPILPQCVWEVVESPTPVICGILSVSVVNEYKIEHGIVVDLDEGSILSEEGDEENILSDSMKKAWYQGINLADTIPPDDYVHAVFLSDAYMKVFIISLKHYKKHIVNDVFQKESFIRDGKTKGIRRFLKWFTETTMFSAFIDSVISDPECFTLFDRKIEMYGSDNSNVIITKLREWKGKN